MSPSSLALTRGTKVAAGPTAPGHKQCPLWLVGGLVQVDDLDAAERLAVVVDKGAALPAVGRLWSRKGHSHLQLNGVGCTKQRLARDRTPQWFGVLLPTLADRRAIR